MGKALTAIQSEFGRAGLYELRRPLAKHVHREAHAIYCLGGATASGYVCDTKYPMRPSSAMAINPWEPHTFEPCPSGASTKALVLYINLTWLHRDKSVASRFGQKIFDLTKELHDHVAELTRLIVCESTDSEQIETCVRTLVNATITESQVLPTVVSTKPAAQNRDQRIVKSMRLMRQHFQQSIHHEEIAKVVGLSRPHFYKLFKDQTGITPNLFLNVIRMEIAMDMLVNTRASITEIGQNLGYNSQASFTRFFYMNAGLSPTEYRQGMTITNVQPNANIPVFRMSG